MQTPLALPLLLPSPMAWLQLLMGWQCILQSTRASACGA